MCVFANEQLNLNSSNNLFLVIIIFYYLLFIVLVFLPLKYHYNCLRSYLVTTTKQELII